jgi:hypothetical protein
LFATLEARRRTTSPDWEWCDLGGEPYDSVLYGEESDDQAQAAGGRS